MRTRIAVSLAAILGTLPALAQAGIARPEPDATLDEMRGGFVTAGGLTFNLGIVSSTYIDGQLALRTSLATSPTAPSQPTAPTAPTGPTAPTTPTAPTPAASAGAAEAAAGARGSDQPLSPTPPPAPPPAAETVPAAASAQPAQPAPGPSLTIVSQPPAEAQTSVAAPGPTPSPSSTPSDLRTTITTPDGQTTIVQDLNPSRLTNLVVNSADAKSIRQDTSVDLVLPGFQSVQQDHLLSTMGMRIGADGAFGIISAIPR